MAVDAEALGDIGAGEGGLHVLHAVGESATLVGGKGDDRLALQVIAVFLINAFFVEKVELFGFLLIIKVKLH